MLTAHAMSIDPVRFGDAELKVVQEAQFRNGAGLLVLIDIKNIADRNKVHITVWRSHDSVLK